MGWLSGWKDRKSLIKHLTESQKGVNPAVLFETLTHCARGNVLWKVVTISDVQPNGEKVERDRFIECDLLGRCGGDWGYKDMTESMGPCYYTCPLSYLEMVPCPENSQWAKEWREKVRQQASVVHAPAGSYLVFDAPVRFGGDRAFVAFQRMNGRSRDYRGLTWSDIYSSVVQTVVLLSINVSTLGAARRVTKEEAEKAVYDAQFPITA